MCLISVATCRRPVSTAGIRKIPQRSAARNEGVTKHTDGLIVGELGWPLLDDGRPSSSLARAKSYRGLIASDHGPCTQTQFEPICPHCGVIGQATLVHGRSHRSGMYQCNACREPFTAMIGTVMESSHIPMTKWALAFHLMASSKKGYSAHQLMRTLGLGSYRTAWFMAHRIREAMFVADPEPFGGKDKVVEVDETFIGKPESIFVSGKGWQDKRGTATKRKVMTLVERGGRAKSFKVKDLDAKTINEVLFNISFSTADCIPMKRSITRNPARNSPSMSASIILKANMLVAT